jgi:membrane peptidoglycan carboxypeptidase
MIRKSSQSGRKIFLFWMICLGLTLFNFLVPFQFDLNIDYSTRYFARDRDNRIIEISPLEKPSGILRIEIDSLSELKPEFINCLLSAEDKSFFKGIFYIEEQANGKKVITPGTFRGVPLSGIYRALSHGGKHGGGSGLVQQLAKNMVLLKWEKYAGSQMHLQRKYAEMLTAFALTSVYSGEELLLLYLNTIPVFNISDGRVFGFKAAAFRFYGTSDLSKLTLDQFATMVASLQGGYMRDLESSEKIVERRAKILDRMVKLNFLEYPESERLKKIPVKVSDRFSTYYCFKPAIQYIRRQARQIARDFDLDTNLTNYRIYTTLSRWVQTAASLAVEESFAELDDYRYLHSDTLQVGMAVIAPGSGQLLALVGDADPFHYKGKLNHAYQINRQIGSTVKPFVYASFFEKGGNAESLLLDDSIPGKFNPSNFNGIYSKQKIPAGECLSRSLNMPTANLVNQGHVSVAEIRQLLKICGFRGNIPKSADIVLGSFESSPLEMARMYCTLAGGGHYVPLVCITRIEDENHKIIWELKDLKLKDRKPGKRFIIKPKTVSEINKSLTAATEPGGTGNRVRNFYNGPVAGKTGTTSNNRDAWFIGYNDNLCGAVWYGYDKNSQLPDQINTGGRIAAPTWGRMLNNLEKMGITAYSKPSAQPKE